MIRDSFCTDHSLCIHANLKLKSVPNVTMTTHGLELNLFMHGLRQRRTPMLDLELLRD